MATQKQKIQTFREATQATHAQANKLLKKNNWELDVSINEWFSSGMSISSRQSSSSSIVRDLFSKYLVDGEDVIGVEGTEQFLADLGLDPSEAVVLVLAKHFQCTTACEFTEEGWLAVIK